MEIKIRVALPKDIPELKKIFKEGDQFHSRLYPKHFISRKNPRSASKIGDWLKSSQGEQIFLVGTIDSKLVGLLQGRTSQFPGVPIIRKVKTLIIEAMVVKQEYRGLGIGGLLLREVERFAKAGKYRRLALNVLVKNDTAIALYQRAGFNNLSIKMEKEL